MSCQKAYKKFSKKECACKLKQNSITSIFKVYIQRYLRKDNAQLKKKNEQFYLDKSK